MATGQGHSSAVITSALAGTNHPRAKGAHEIAVPHHEQHRGPSTQHLARRLCTRTRPMVMEARAGPFQDWRPARGAHLDPFLPIRALAPQSGRPKDQGGRAVQLPWPRANGKAAYRARANRAGWHWSLKHCVPWALYQTSCTRSLLDNGSHAIAIQNIERLLCGL